jgi:sulfatase maturation enzyme AslB (radical SAM superfamily)
MGNLLITARCNRRCSFCFARRRIAEMIQEKEKGLNMTREDIRTAMDFMERTEERSLRLLGGEPTLHPEFVEIVNEGLRRNFHIHLFTNAIMTKEIADFVAGVPKERLSILCNISPQAADTERQKSMRLYALERLGDRISLGITITSPEFEYQYLIDHIKQFKLRPKIRVGVAQPIVGKENDYLKPSDYGAAGRSIVNMARACVEEDILIGFDCGMTLCMFTEAELGVLATRSDGYSSVCDPIIDIGPNLDIWHCFPLSEVLNSNLRKFRNRRDAAQFYRAIVGAYRNLGCKPECMTCKFKLRGQCFGGCLAHTMNALNRIPPRHAEEPEEVRKAHWPAAETAKDPVVMTGLC